MDDQNLRYVYDMMDRYDPETKTQSMARTTGYTATTAIRMLARGLFDQKGISPPEFIGKNEKCVAFMLNGLAERGVIYQRKIEVI